MRKSKADASGEVVVTEVPVVVTESSESNGGAGLFSKARTVMLPRASDARVRLAPHVLAARQAATEAAKERVVPAAEVAAARARQTLIEELIPQVTAAVTTAVTASEPYRREAQRRGQAAALALRGVEPPEAKQTHKLRNLVLALGLGGVAAAGYKWFTGNDADASWQQAYQPTPAQSQTSSMSSVPSDASGDSGTDIASAVTSDEAASDIAEEPQAAAWPGDPLESDISDSEPPATRL
jgi:endonuclease YncB( thermonuclease family)